MSQQKKYFFERHLCPETLGQVFGYVTDFFQIMHLELDSFSVRMNHFHAGVSGYLFFLIEPHFKQMHVYHVSKSPRQPKTKPELS